MLNFSNTIYLFNYQPTIYRPQGQNKETCKSPNFIDFYKKCVICELHHCLYCFNYLASDPTKTTLGFYESYSLIDEEIKVGCAQCKEGFIFQFSSGQCIYKSQSQQNFLRSFINLDENEICTLSDINDFSIALEILNCQIHILNCKYCIYTLQQTIKSLTCEDGYLVSANTGIRLIPNSSANQIISKNQQEFKLMVNVFNVLLYVKFVKRDQRRKQIQQIHIFRQLLKI
ncbi:unnamed protein product [Paramecium pentaurelia]|uniref:Uncharacterized protein n=1 Tax=Paramecium pentaurelia TaxID=43138 RepID=A0A8S1VNE6_9CILI|nr:unnamed protein product [Paramecium pentaurelia]